MELNAKNNKQLGKNIFNMPVSNPSSIFVLAYGTYIR